MRVCERACVRCVGRCRAPCMCLGKHERVGPPSADPPTQKCQNHKTVCVYGATRGPEERKQPRTGNENSFQSKRKGRRIVVGGFITAVGQAQLAVGEQVNVPLVSLKTRAMTHACVRACVRVCVRACVRAFVRACVRTCARDRACGRVNPSVCASDCVCVWLCVSVSVCVRVRALVWRAY